MAILGPNHLTTYKDNGIVDNEVIGTIDFYGNDASSNATGITGQIESRASANSTDGRNYTLGFKTRAGSAGYTEKLTIDHYGSVGIGETNPTYKLMVNGEPAANGHTLFTSYSDMRLKENITPVESVLSKILRLNPVSFTYSDKTRYANAAEIFYSGFIAQELIESFPSMVGTAEIDGTEYYDSNLSSLPIYLVKAMQEQQEIIEVLKTQNEDLLAGIEALEANLD